MSYNATHRRNLSVPASKTPLDPTPTPTPGSATIQEISTHFSRLYLNHKARSFLTPSAQPQSHSTASTTLTKSQSQKTRLKPLYFNEEHDPQEESIEKAIIISSKQPAKNVNLFPEKGEFRRLQHGYEVKERSLGLIGIDRCSRWPLGSRSQVEVVDFLAFNGVKVVSADMPQFMRIHAVDLTRKTYDSLEKFTAKTLALTLKKEFDGAYGPAWHCIVGLSFGSYVTHSVGGFLYFSMDQKLYVLLFKTAVPRVAR